MNQFSTSAGDFRSNDLVRLGYVSECADGLGTLQLVRLYFKAYSDSIDHQITGMLICDGKKVGNVIEGNGDSVQAHWELINMDNRYKNTSLFEKQIISTRLYDNWSMHIKDGFVMSLMYPQCSEAVKEIDSRSTEELLGMMHAYAGLVHSTH